MTAVCVFFSCLAVGVWAGIWFGEKQREFDRDVRLTLADIDRERCDR